MFNLGRVHAASNDGYAAAKFAGIDTYDFPAQCYDTDPLRMSPQNGTNIQKVIPGIPDSDLTWDLVTHSNKWYAYLYSKTDSDTVAEQVYNCNLLDASVRGGIGYLYGYTDDDGLNDSTATDDPTTDSAPVPTTDANFQMYQLNPPLSTPGGSITPKGITLHWWGGTSGGRGINALEDALRGNTTCGDGGCSVQVGITADGKVYQMTNSLTDLTYHAAGANNTTIGIEIEGVGKTTGSDADFGLAGIKNYPAKFNAVVNTVKFLVKKYNIPLNGHVVCGDVIGVHPHKAYNACPLDGKPQDKTDIDDAYFNAVMKAVGQN
jgi:hypothetical protein